MNNIMQKFDITIKQPRHSKLCGAACVAMICSYDLPELYRSLNEKYSNRGPFTLESELEKSIPYFVLYVRFLNLLHHITY